MRPLLMTICKAKLETSASKPCKLHNYFTFQPLACLFTFFSDCWWDWWEEKQNVHNSSLPLFVTKNIWLHYIWSCFTCFQESNNYCHIEAALTRLQRHFVLLFLKYCLDNRYLVRNNRWLQSGTLQQLPVIKKLYATRSAKNCQLIFILFDLSATFYSITRLSCPSSHVLELPLQERRSTQAT